jgi:hypothetical protein
MYGNIIKIIIAKHSIKLKSLDSSSDDTGWTAKESAFDSSQ